MEGLTEKQLLGVKMMQQFFGDELLGTLRAGARDDLAGKTGAEYIAETCFASYARPALTFQQRSLINLGMLVALNRGPELRIHVNAALHNGLSEEQIVEAVRHAMVYCGVPAGRDALSVVSEVLEEKRVASKRSGGAKLS